MTLQIDVDVCTVTDGGYHNIPSLSSKSAGITSLFGIPVIWQNTAG